MKFDRASGILLHITSLPGGYGIGDLGPAAYQWLGFLSESACTYWQILPAGPTGFGDSPYQCFSANAGNHYLISPDQLIEVGLLEKEDLLGHPNFEEETVNFGLFIPWKNKLLEKSFIKFSEMQIWKREYLNFIEKEKEWLEDYALFMAIKEDQNLVSWTDWPINLRDKENNALIEFKSLHSKVIEKHKFFQFIFFHQWAALKKYATTKNIKIIGDLPIYVAHDSVDVWANPNLFSLLPDGKPEKVSGVPPDYFSPSGQLWGNPIYRWETHQESGYQWWIKRISKLIEMVDLIRLDHFRGFAGYWEIPAGNTTAENGEWKEGPGRQFFDALKKHFGNLPFIAEDLGVITPDVTQLRDQFSLAGMRILQFAFDGDSNHSFLPHNYPEHTVAYSGTHDNEPFMGWYQSASGQEKIWVDDYLKSIPLELPWSIIHSLWRSKANLVLIQMQDSLALGSESRMNYPSTAQGNWKWRMKPNALSAQLSKKLSQINKEFNR